LQLVPGDATQVNFRPCDACVQALLLQVLAASAEAAYVAGETHGAFEGQVNKGDRDAFVTKIGFA